VKDWQNLKRGMKPQVDQQQINAQARMSQVSDIPEKGVDEVKKDDSLKKPSEGIEIHLFSN